MVSPGVKEELTTDSVLAAIPAFSPAVLKVMDLLAQADTEMAVLSRTIAVDATLSAEILKLANSALFGATARIDTVQKAVVTLGHSWIQHVTLRAGAVSYVRSAAQTEELKRSWRHTLATAALCRILARASGLSPERAYTLGLMHDIGRLGLLAAFPPEYTAAIQAAECGGMSLADAEKALFGVDHGELGRRLLESWNLPEEFARIASGHHKTPSDVGFDLLNVVQLSCRLADGLGYWLVQPAAGWSLESTRQLIPEPVRGRFPYDEQPLIDAVEEALADNGSLHLSEPHERPRPDPPPGKREMEPAPVDAPEFELSESGSGPWKIILILAVAVAVIGTVALKLFR